METVTVELFEIDKTLPITFIAEAASEKDSKVN